LIGLSSGERCGLVAANTRLDQSGCSALGDEGFENVVNADEFEWLPMVLETPTSDGKSYKENIEKTEKIKKILSLIT